MDLGEKPNFNLNPQFKTITDEEKKQLLAKRNSKNTNGATKQWMGCFMNYLIEKNLPDIHEIQTSDLDGILENFYA